MPLRNSVPQSNGINKYTFSEQELEYDNWMDRYIQLFTKAQKVVALKATMTPQQKKEFSESTLSEDEKAEMKSLKQKIEAYKKAQKKGPQSILKDSHKKPVFDRGKDNLVYLSSTGKHVIKYSCNNANSRMVEYLQKKYQILRFFMGKFIPQSVFVFGEKRVEMDSRIDSNLRNNRDNRDVAITIQRKVEGKTFAEITPEEKSNPIILLSLREAFNQYWALKRQVARISNELGFDSQSLNISLELGKLSKEPESDQFDQEEAINFKSPNIMWDEAKKCIFFIDFDIGEWDENQEQIYEALMTNGSVD